MAKHKRRRRPNQDQAASSSSTSGVMRQRWCLAVGVVVAAVALAMYVDWWRSGWSEQSPSPETVAPPVSDSAADVNVAAPITEEDLAALRTHEELMEAMTRVAATVVTTYPEDPAGHDLQGRIYAYLGKSAEATRAWERCLELDPRRPDACNGLATLAIKRGDDVAAESLLKQALALEPAFHEAVHQLAELAARNGRSAEAVAVLQSYVEQVPSAADSLLLLAQTQLQLGALEKAQQNFEAVIKLRPTSSEACLGLGTTLIRLGRRDEARQYLEQSRALRAQKPAAPPGLTAQAYDMLQSRVNCAGTVFYAARIYESHSQLEVAARLGRQALALDPKNLPVRLFLIALYQEMDRLSDAIEVCQDTVAADPQNPDLVLRLGALQALAGRMDIAETLLKQVIQLAPQQARGYAGLAEFYLQSKPGGEEAVRLAREAVRLEPIALHYVLLSQCLAQAGELQQARSALDEAIKAEPNNELYRQLRDELGAQR